MEEPGVKPERNKMSNKTTQVILELEEVLSIVPCNTISAEITAESKTEMEDAAAYLSCRIVHPFEGFENDYYYFDYALPKKPGSKITVRGKENYRVQTIIKEI